MGTWVDYRALHFPSHFVCLEDITREAGIRSSLQRPLIAIYLGGCSSPFSQPITSSVLIGSGRSHSRHWNTRGPLPPGGSARIKKAPQPGQIGRSPVPMDTILPRDQDVRQFHS
jgi:hypothetical protein